jgi:SHS2 domain-containing protein
MSGEAAGWEHFAHEAAVGVRGFGPTREAAFEQGALALMHAIADPDRIKPSEMVEIACAAPDDALLFVDWLNTLIFEVATRGVLFCRFEVRIDAGHRAEPGASRSTRRATRWRSRSRALPIRI